MRACVRACVRVCVCVCAHARVCVCAREYGRMYRQLISINIYLFIYVLTKKNLTGSITVQNTVRRNVS